MSGFFVTFVNLDKSVGITSIWSDRKTVARHRSEIPSCTFARFVGTLCSSYSLAVVFQPSNNSRLPYVGGAIVGRYFVRSRGEIPTL